MGYFVILCLGVVFGYMLASFFAAGRCGDCQLKKFQEENYQ